MAEPAGGVPETSLAGVGLGAAQRRPQFASYAEPSRFHPGGREREQTGQQRRACQIRFSSRSGGCSKSTGLGLLGSQRLGTRPAPIGRSSIPFVRLFRPAARFQGLELDPFLFFIRIVVHVVVPTGGRTDGGSSQRLLESRRTGREAPGRPQAPTLFCPAWLQPSNVPVRQEPGGNSERSRAVGGSRPARQPFLAAGQQRRRGHQQNIHPFRMQHTVRPSAGPGAGKARFHEPLAFRRHCRSVGHFDQDRDVAGLRQDPAREPISPAAAADSVPDWQRRWDPHADDGR